MLKVSKTTDAPVENKGEGDKASAKRFNENEQAFVRAGKVDDAAGNARESIDGPEREKLEKAEARGKRPARS